MIFRDLFEFVGARKPLGKQLRDFGVQPGTLLTAARVIRLTLPSISGHAIILYEGGAETEHAAGRRMDGIVKSGPPLDQNE